MITCVRNIKNEQYSRLQWTRRKRIVNNVHFWDKVCIEIGYTTSNTLQQVHTSPIKKNWTHPQCHNPSKLRTQSLKHFKFKFCFRSLIIVHSQDTSMPNHSSISSFNFVVSFRNFNTNHIITYLDFLLYVRVTPNFLALLSFMEFLGLVASLACTRSSASAMVDDSPLILEFLLFAFYLVESGLCAWYYALLMLWKFALALMVEETEVRAEFG